MYIDGNLIKRVTWKFQGKNNTEPVTFGKGWGGPWFMKGKVAEMRIYSVPLRPEECKEISVKSLRKLNTKNQHD